MTNEEAKVFLDNLIICVNEHPVVADWLIEIANRKTEPQTEDEILREQCRAFMYIVEQTDCAWKGEKK